MIRKPLELSQDDSELIARYLIEPRGKPEIEYNYYNDRSMYEVKSALDALLGIFYTFDPANMDDIKSHTLNVFWIFNNKFDRNWKGR